MKEIIRKSVSRKYLEGLDTPKYLYFQDQTEENIKEFKKFVENDIEVLYAIKSNNHENIIKSCISNNFGFDVASKEELEYVYKLGADISKISFSAPTKLEKDLIYANKLGVKYYAFDSEIEIKKIIKNVENPSLIARITTPNQDAIFNLSAKFGMPGDYFERVLRRAKKMNWPLEGITFHVGSQNTSIMSWQKALAKVSYYIDLAETYGIKIKYLNIGGGIPTKYENGVKDKRYYIENICLLVNRFRRRHKLDIVMVEPGRAMSANTMILVSKVVNIKRYKRPSMIILDTSVFNGIIEPLEHFEYPLLTLNDIYGKKKDDKDNGKRKYYSVGGVSCDGYDIIKSKILLPQNISVGDTFVIPYAGAYTFVYEDFHMRKYPDILEV